jgi:Zn-dependent protease
MRDQGIWSLSLGRWGGLRVRLHMFFLLFAAFALFLGWQTDNNTPGSSFQLAAISLAILLASVLLHEIGHLQSAVFFGGSMDQMLLAPLGGLSAMRPPRDPRREVLAHLAGPLVNLLLALVCITLLAAFAPGASGIPWGLLSPLGPAGVTGLPEKLSWDCLRLAAWINWMLALVNLLPAYPFDGGRALRAGLAPLWRSHGRQQASRAVARIAMITAVALLVAALCLALFQSDAARAFENQIVPVWFALALLGIFLLFSARLEEERREAGEEEDDRFFDYDFSAGYTSLERAAEAADDAETGPFSQWLEERKAARQRRQREREVEDEQRVDEILARLHAQGMASLSAEDKALLQRVSARYRSRQGNKA